MHVLAFSSTSNLFQKLVGVKTTGHELCNSLLSKKSVKNCHNWPELGPQSPLWPKPHFSLPNWSRATSLTHLSKPSSQYGDFSHVVLI